MLGIEACRVALLNEIQDVIREVSYVNFRHLAMLVDCMTGESFSSSLCLAVLQRRVPGDSPHVVAPQLAFACCAPGV